MEISSTLYQKCCQLSLTLIFFNLHSKKEMLILCNSSHIGNARLIDSAGHPCFMHSENVHIVPQYT